MQELCNLVDNLTLPDFHCTFHCFQPAVATREAQGPWAPLACTQLTGMCRGSSSIVRREQEATMSCSQSSKTITYLA